MSLDENLKGQVKQYLALLEKPVIFQLSIGDDDNSKKLKEFVEEIANLSDKLSIEESTADITPSFTLKSELETGNIRFAGVPLGHEFQSFILALLQVGGRAPKIEDAVKERIQKLEGERHFQTFVSLSCHNCPDVVQALNIMAVLNKNIHHTMIEGGMHKELVDKHDIMAVPTVFLEGELFESGRMSLEDIIDKVSDSKVSIDTDAIEPFDVLVIGGGPAGASAAIYAARKGIRTGLLAEEFGGQVNETLGIENFIGTPYTEGPKLMGQVKEHVQEYPIELIERQRASHIEKNAEGQVVVSLENGGQLISQSVVIATGARWRLINVPGEKEFKTKGVAYCPHCDGPLFKGKKVVVIGGGNSGVEAALDLAGIVSEVTILEFADKLKADQILQDRVKEKSNIKVILEAATTEITGEGKVNGLTYTDRATNESHHLDCEGVFILVGLLPNTEFLEDTGIERNKFGEIHVDNHGATSMEGVFAAGDCTNVAYKQIIISMGAGATASLGAFDYLIRK